MEARELSDRTILDAMRRGGGVASIEHPSYGVFSLALMQGERPIQFLQRFRGEYGAWYNEQEYQASSKARAIKDSLREADSGPKIIVPASQSPVQAPQASLADTIKSQVASLGTRRMEIETELEQVYERTRELCTERSRIDRELSVSEKFLKELEEGGNKPPTPSKMGKNFPRQVRQRKSRSSEGMGTPHRAEVGEPSGTSDGAGDSVGTEGRT